MSQPDPVLFLVNVCNALLKYGLVVSIFISLWRVLRKQPSEPTNHSLRFQMLMVDCTSYLFACPLLSKLLHSRLIVFLALALFLIAKRSTNSVKPLPEVLWFWLLSTIASLLGFLSNTSNRVNLILFGISIASLILQCTVTSVVFEPGYDQSTVFGKITVSYMHPLLAKSTRRPINRSDFPLLPRDLSTDLCYRHFEGYLDKAKLDEKYHLLWAVLKSIKYKVAATFALSITADLITYSRSNILAQFLLSIRLYQQKQVGINVSLIWGSLIAIVQLVTASMASSEALLSNMTFVSTRSALMGAIYRKALVLSPKAKEAYPNSKIMNLLNVDTAMMQLIHRHIINLTGAPVGLIVCSWQIYSFLGKSSVAAVPVLVVFIPFSYWYTRRMFKRFPEMMAVKDSRTKAAWNIFQNIKSLKLHAWEDPYEHEVDTKRKQEVKVQTKYLRLQAIMSSFSTMLDDFLAIACFLTFLAWTGNALTPEIVFPTLSLLSYLSEPFLALPRSISGIGRCITAQRRIADFLSQPELPSRNYYHSPESPSDQDLPLIYIENATMYWSEDISDSTLALLNVDFTAKRGDLICVLGKVGAGKTALLKTLTRQMYIAQGSVRVNGSIAYFSQDTWLQYDTIKSNILFGTENNQKLYEMVLDACDLNKDLDQLPHGDLTEIGEKGICLSGGQKARVALARAVYSCADIYVLDDFLAAVDEHVSRTLMTKLLAPDGLLAGKTVVLATNSHKVLQYATRVYALEEKTLKSVEESSIKLSSQPVLIARELRLDANVFSATPTLQESAHLVEAIESHLNSESEDQHVAVTSVFKRYLKSAGTLTCALAIFYLVFSVITLNAITLWLSFWSNKAVHGIIEAKWYAIVYFLLTLFAGIFTFMSLFQFLGKVGNKASTSLHATMIDSVVNSPMLFFETTPLGSIMNRFTGDISTLDSTVPQMIHTFSRAILGAVTSIFIMIGGAPLILLVLGPIFWLYNQCRKLYLSPSRQLQRMSAASRGPILSHIEESLKGLSTIIAFHRTNSFIENYELRSDSWMKSVFVRVSLNQWLNWRVGALTSLLTLSAVLSSVSLVYLGAISAGIVGVVLHNTQRCGMTISRIIKTVGDLEVSAVSVQRIFEYIDLKPEGPRLLESDPPKQDWPNAGSIKMVDFSVRYRPELELALKHISLHIHPNEKIGIVGRTGAGKSTISLSLFRILEAATGTLSISDRDVSKLGLRTLRQGLSIIPQDAQIFQGTLRQNLDPLGYSDDSSLWNTLDLCHLRTHFESPALQGLDTLLLAGGENLSRGQAQLICLGRSLVHESRFLILDEATASVDLETDQIVQQTIRTQFKDRTIVTIAHRLDTIMDSDRIIVLDKGEIAEFDTPQTLLSRPGAFSDLCKAHTEL